VLLMDHILRNMKQSVITLFDVHIDWNIHKYFCLFYSGKIIYFSILFVYSTAKKLIIKEHNQRKEHTKHTPKNKIPNKATCIIQAIVTFNLLLSHQLSRGE
jgi:hypothetical protein